METSSTITPTVESTVVLAEKKIDSKFRKRKMRLFKKAYELGKLCDADICLIVSRKEKYYVYKSKDDPLWPPSLQNIVSFDIY